jgi:hypothetical protein
MFFGPHEAAWVCAITIFFSRAVLLVAQYITVRHLLCRFHDFELPDASLLCPREEVEQWDTFLACCGCNNCNECIPMMIRVFHGFRPALSLSAYRNQH